MRRRAYVAGRWIATGLLFLMTAGFARAVSSDNNTCRTFSGVTTNLGQTVYVGYDGAHNRLTVSGGAHVESSEACIGGNPPGHANWAQVTGVGSEWMINGALYVGYRAGSSRLTILDGAQVQADSVYVGWDGQSVGNLLEVGADAVLVVTNACYRPASCEVRRGMLWLSGGTVLADTVSIWEDSTFGGSGTVIGETQCAGTLEPGTPIGTLVQEGGLALAFNAVAVFEIGGYVPDSEFDRVAVNGHLCLAGTLSLSLVNGFIPSGGDRFVVMTGSSVSGLFSDVVILNCPPELVADVVVNDASVTIVFSAR